MRIFGLILIVVSLVVPAYGFTTYSSRLDFGALFSQYLGSAALILMGYAQLMATRAPGLEWVFGGLDRIYRLHKWIAVIAMAFVLLHDTIDAEGEGFGPETALTDLAETLGELSLYGLLILVTITLATFIPYHLWRWTHKFVGAFFAFSAFHYAFILKPFDLSEPLGLYILFFCLLGIACYAITLAPESWSARRHRYKVSEVDKSGAALTVTLTPEQKGLRHKAGQFAFLQFELPGTKEVHPFTISQAPRDDRQLRFSIKPIGDDTQRLARELSTGTTAFVKGPFGHFYPPRSQATQVWIAGGIGITPFVAWSEALYASNVSQQGQTPSATHLFYSVRHREEAAHLDALEALAAKEETFHLHLIETARAGRLSVEQIQDTLGSAGLEAEYAFCGPASLGQMLRQAHRRGQLGRGAPRFEYFEIRSGIGFTKLFAWIWKVIAGRFLAVGK